MSQSTGSWTTATVGGHPCDIFEPARRNEHGYAVIYLHGVHLTGLVGNAAYTGQFERHGLPVIVPHTKRSWWTDKICPEFDASLTAERHILQNILPYADQRWNARPPTVALLGTSMGGQGALRLAFKHPNKFPIVAALAPAIDYQIRFRDAEPDDPLLAMYEDAEAARQDTATLHVHPLNWPRNTWFASDPADVRWHDSAQRLHMKMSALGIMHEHDLETSAGGHSWQYYNHMVEKALGFIAERLDQERRKAGG